MVATASRTTLSERLYMMSAYCAGSFFSSFDACQIMPLGASCQAGANFGLSPKLDMARDATQFSIFSSSRAT